MCQEWEPAPEVENISRRAGTKSSGQAVGTAIANQAANAAANFFGRNCEQNPQPALFSFVQTAQRLTVAGLIRRSYLEKAPRTVLKGKIKLLQKYGGQGPGLPQSVDRKTAARTNSRPKNDDARTKIPLTFRGFL